MTLGDSTLFVCGNERSPSLLLPPSKDATLSWKLIPSQARRSSMQCIHVHPGAGRNQLCRVQCVHGCLNTDQCQCGGHVRACPLVASPALSMTVLPPMLLHVWLSHQHVTTLGRSWADASLVICYAVLCCAGWASAAALRASSGPSSQLCTHHTEPTHPCAALLSGIAYESIALKHTELHPATMSCQNALASHLAYTMSHRTVSLQLLCLCKGTSVWSPSAFSCSKPVQLLTLPGSMQRSCCCQQSG